MEQYIAIPKPFQLSWKNWTEKQYKTELLASLGLRPHSAIITTPAAHGHVAGLWTAPTHPNPDSR